MNQSEEGEIPFSGAREFTFQTSDGGRLQSKSPTSFEGLVKKFLSNIREGIIVTHDVALSQLQDLKARAVIEAGWTGYRQGSKLFADVVELETHLIGNQWQGAERVLDRILRDLQPFDIKTTLFLICKAEDAAHQVKGQHIILLFGVTGAGKSLLTHFFCGSTLELVMDGITRIEPVKIRPELAKALEGVRVGREMKSETRYISAIRIEDPAALFNDYFGPPGSLEKCVVICDAPGIQDTCGAEIDVANAAGLIKAAQNAKSVRPVLVINADGGAKFESLKILLKTLKRCMTNTKDCLKSFSYIFNKYNDSNGVFGKDNILSKLQSIAKYPNDDESTDEDFMMFIKDMVRRARSLSQSNHIHTVNPLMDSPGSLLDDLMEQTPIERPDKAFRFNVCQSTLDKIQQQLQQQKACILDSCQRGDVELVAQKLEELRVFQEALQLDMVHSAYQACRQELVNYLTNQYTEAIEYLDRHMKDGYPLSHGDVNFFLSRWKRSRAFDVLRDPHNLEMLEYVGPGSYEDIVGRHVQRMKASILGLDSLIRLDCGGIETYSTRLEKFCLLCRSVDKLSDYVETQYEVATKLENCFDGMASALSEGGYHHVAASLYAMSNAVQFRLALHVPIDGITPEMWYDRMVTLVKKNLEAQFNDVTVREPSNALFLSEGDLKHLQNSLENLRQAQATTQLLQYLPDGMISNIRKELERRVIERFQSIIEAGRKLFETKKECCFADLGSFVKHMEAVRTLPGIDIATAQLFHQFFEQVVGFLNQMKTEVEEVMNKVSVQSLLDAPEQYQLVRPNISRLPFIIAGMKQANWIEEYRNGAYVQAVQSIEYAIVQHAERIRAAAYPFDIEDCNWSVTKTALILEEFEYLSKLEGTIPGLDAMHSEVKAIVTRSMGLARQRVRVQSSERRT